MPQEKKLEFDLEVIDTPKGKVPNVKSLQHVVDILNDFNADLNEHRSILNDALIKQLAAYELELNNLKSTIIESRTEAEATKEVVKSLQASFATQNNQLLVEFKKLEDRIAFMEHQTKKAIADALHALNQNILQLLSDK